MGKDQKVDFNLEGRFLGFLIKDGYKIKGLHLAAADGEHTIKLTKEARASCHHTLIPGEWIQVRGYQKIKSKDDAQLKALSITRVTPGSTESLPPLPPLSEPAPSSIPKAKILVCQKSDCCKRGGRAVSEALETALRDRNLSEQVAIKCTGCMKQCKAGPNLIMPDKTRYSRIRPEAIPELLDKHFQTNAV